MFVFSKGTPKTFNPILDDTIYKHKEEKGYVRLKNGDTKIFNGKRGKSKKYRHNIFSYNLGKTSKHPAIFPDKLVEDHIKIWSNSGDLVLDPFVGSGTTTCVAKKLGRNYIGFDSSKEYVAMSKKRLKESK
jgi:site-specific DNA-methyltransferase (adenine-specific)